ncbi:hypothetical protein AVEN_136613-1 [Araneus ventricosus]|uniref:Uncharacterized protein n=1 Tax=Araneus ventricosus TaxID=182803 RepID=A0A4Y2CAJ3_ARAVE|nr:hypothetical protein AVEN_136613-1 [Araneus ventricosus]
MKLELYVISLSEIRGSPFYLTAFPFQPSPTCLLFNLPPSFPFCASCPHVRQHPLQGIPLAMWVDFDTDLTLREASRFRVFIFPLTCQDRRYHRGYLVCSQPEGHKLAAARIENSTSIRHFRPSSSIPPLTPVPAGWAPE